MEEAKHSYMCIVAGGRSSLAFKNRQWVNFAACETCAKYTERVGHSLQMKGTQIGSHLSNVHPSCS